jgi:hypothetical protein
MLRGGQALLSVSAGFRIRGESPTKLLVQVERSKDSIPLWCQRAITRGISRLSSQPGGKGFLHRSDGSLGCSCSVVHFLFGLTCFIGVPSEASGCPWTPLSSAISVHQTNTIYKASDVLTMGFIFVLIRAPFVFRFLL